MLFYKIEARMTNMSENKNSKNQKKFAVELQAKLLDFHQKHADGWMIYISSMRGTTLTMGAIIQDTETLSGAVQSFLSVAGIEYEVTETGEVTLQVTQSLLRTSENNGFIKDDTDIFTLFGLEELMNRTNINYSEKMLPEAVKKNELLKKAGLLLCAESVTEELKRIFQPASHFAAGHPVHYLIQSESDEISESICKLTLSALLMNNRIRSKRYCSVKLDNSYSYWDEDELQALYKSCTGGAVVLVVCNRDLEDEADNRSGDVEQLEKACRIARKYRNNTLTVFCLPRVAEKIKAVLRERLGAISLVEMAEDKVPGAKAKTYLRRAARGHGVKPDKKLIRTVDSEIKTFSPSELNRVFDMWYDNRLKTYCYPQYAAFESTGLTEAGKKPRGSAYAELESLIGLTEAKAVIKQAVDYFKAQKLFSDRGLKGDRPSMHMVFSGSPGTAKTTVARLFAQIMRDNDILSVGGLHEVSRADLVGKYVGWTAKTVVEKFRAAMGSVLFIDEAYSLLDDRDGSYGDEAINTIVAEMENHREDIVVIFAGYSDKMEMFLRKNPGLRSRIAFHVPFADYKPDELMQIMEFVAGKQSVVLDAGVKGKLLPILTAAARSPDSGNGRFVRNLFEKARMKQSSRLLAMDVEMLTKDDVSLLLAEDFESPSAKSNQLKRTIGFGVAI